MNQYTPPNNCKYSNLLSKVSEDDYEEVINFALTIGVNNAFIQEDGTATESFIPDFDKSIV